MRISPASNSTCVLPRLSTISSGTVALPRSVMTSVPFDWASSSVATTGVAPGSPPCSHTSTRAPWRATPRGSRVAVKRWSGSDPGPAPAPRGNARVAAPRPAMRRKFRLVVVMVSSRPEGLVPA